MKFGNWAMASLMVSIVFTGCIPFTSREPKAEELVGHFVGEDGSSFVLRADGVIELSDIPSTFLYSSAEKAAPITGEAKWVLDGKRLEIDIVVSYPDSSRQVRHRTYLPVSERNGQFGLMIEVDAGDGGYLYYDRKS